MQRNIVIASLKGGPGKTSTTLGLAGAFAVLGRHVALYDGDPQATLTKATRLAPVAAPWAEPPVRLEWGVQTPVWLYRGGRPLAKATDEELQEFFERVGGSATAEIGLFDTPPGNLDVVLAACAVADIVVAPVNMDLASLDGLVDVMEMVAALDPPPPVVVLLNGLKKNRNLARAIREEVERRYQDILLPNEVPEDGRCPEVPEKGLPVTIFAPRTRASEALLQVAADLDARLARAGSVTHALSGGGDR